MLSIAKVNEVKKAHPRIWRQATIEQKKMIADTHEKTGSIPKAYKAFRAYKITDADLTFVGQRYGGGR